MMNASAPSYTGLVPCQSSLCHMVSMVRDGVISPVGLVEAHLRQIESRNPALNAFVTVLADGALEEARAREAGEPAGLLSRKGRRAAKDATVVARLRRQGAILLGKTNTPELLASYETDNAITGRTNHPWDPRRTPGGSSGGEAAAIAAFCSPGGIASDGGGSIRVPAHFCGIAGFKPTPGRIPGTGHFPSLGYPGGLAIAVGPMARASACGSSSTACRWTGKFARWCGARPDASVAPAPDGERRGARDAGLRDHRVPARGAQVGSRRQGDRVVPGHDAGGGGERASGTLQVIGSR